MAPVHAAVLPASLVAALALASPALAQTQRVHDHAHDVVDRHGHVLPHDTGADITSFTTVFTHQRLTFRLSLRHVPAHGYLEAFAVRTPSALYTVGALQYASSTTLDLQRSDRNDQEVPCDGLTQHRTRTQVVVVLPTSCVGTPGWVRTGAGAGDKGGADDARRNGTVDEDRLRLGPRIRP